MIASFKGTGRPVFFACLTTYPLRLSISIFLPLIISWDKEGRPSPKVFWTVLTNVFFKSFLISVLFSDSRVITHKSVALAVKKYTAIAGLDSNKYSGHSLRSGFATSAAELGAEERNIMAMTGHKTTQMVRRYIQEANLFKNNALNKIKI